MDNNNDVVLYTTQDLRRILRCGRDKAYSLMRLKGFPSVQLGGQYLVEKNAFEKWLQIQQGRKVNV